MKTLLLLLIVFPVVASGPKQQRPPVVDLPEHWSQPLPLPESRDIEAVRAWWKLFDDPLLKSLIERALESNLDLKTAGARIAEARAARGVARAALQPSIGASDGYTRVRGGIAQGLTGAGILSGSPQSRTSLLAPFETSVFQLGFDSSWEIDFFGGLRKSLAAAAADVRASQEARNDVRVAVAAEVGRNYLQLRGAQRRLSIVGNNIALQKDSLELTAARRKAGLAPELDVVRAAAQLHETQAGAPPLEARIDQSIHALGVLLRLDPARLVSELRPEAPLPALPESLPTGVPADLLLRRPDLRRAEFEMAAAAARVSAARSDLYPKITLTGLAGRQATEAGNLTLGLGNFFSFGPGVRLPLFTGGRIRSNIAVQQARSEQVVFRYEAAVLESLRDVEDALSAFRHEKDRLDHLREALLHNRDAVSLTRELYSKGLGDYLGVLDAQRELLLVEDQVAQSQTSLAVTLVALYKALGGGWEVSP